MRSYAKEKKRTTPTGVRFDIDKLDFIKQREKLNAPQQVVDFLMNKYWWENKIPTVTAKASPPIELKNDTSFFPKTDLPKQEVYEKPDNTSIWKKRMDECENVEEMDYIGQQVISAGLTLYERNVIQKYGRMICEKKRFI